MWKRSVYRILLGKRDGKRPSRGFRRIRDNITKMNLHDIYGGVDWIDLFRTGTSDRFLCRR